MHWILTAGNLEFFAICPLLDTAMLNTNFSQGGRGQWTVYYTSPHSLIVMFFLFVDLKTLEFLLNLIGWFI